LEKSSHAVFSTQCEISILLPYHHTLSTKTASYYIRVQAEIAIFFVFIKGHDLEGSFESPALQSFQKNLFFSISTKGQRLAFPSGALTFQAV